MADDDTTHAFFIGTALIVSVALLVGGCFLCLIQRKNDRMDTEVSIYLGSSLASPVVDVSSLTILRPGLRRGNSTDTIVC